MVNDLENLPVGWVEDTLGNVFRVVTGKTPSTKNAIFYEPGEIPFVKPGDLDREHPLLVAETSVSKVGATEAPLLPIGSVLVSCIGNLGKVCLLGKETICNQQINAILPCKDIDPRFVYYWTKTIKSWMEAEASATTVTILNKGRFENAPFVFPPKNEQTRIVTAIESLQQRSARARALLTEVDPLLANLRQSILQAAFSGRLTADWRAKNPDVESASQLLARIRTVRRQRWEDAELEKYDAKGKKPSKNWKDKYKEPEPVDDSELPELPDGWCWASADEVAWEITVGHVGSMKDEYVNNGVPFLRSKNVRKDRYDPKDIMYISMEFHQKLRKSKLTPGDLAIVRSGDPGTACVIPMELKEANCSDLVIVRLLPGIVPHFVSRFLNSTFGKRQVIGKQVGVAQQHFNVGSMKSFPIPVAPEAEQRVITNRVKANSDILMSTHGELAIISQSLRSLDQSILSKAFKGELVPQDPNDEPASELLARIRATREKEAAEKKTTRKKKSKKKAVPKRKS